MHPGSDTPRPAPRPGGAGGLGATGQSADALDRSTEAERIAALVPAAAGGRELGETLASLGGVSEAGMWLRTGLVREVTLGQVTLRDGSATLQVELRPSGAAPGAGSQLSLAAFRALDLPLTQLVRLRVATR